MSYLFHISYILFSIVICVDFQSKANKIMFYNDYYRIAYASKKDTNLNASIIREALCKIKLWDKIILFDMHLHLLRVLEMQCIIHLQRVQNSLILVL